MTLGPGSKKQTKNPPKPKNNNPKKKTKPKKHPNKQKKSQDPPDSLKIGSTAIIND